VSRAIAGVFGSAAETYRPAARRALAPHASGDLGASSIAVAWTGDELAEGSLVVLLAGRIQNRRSLAAELGADVELGAESLVSLAFERWGEDLLARLRGSFGLVVWDPAARAGFLAADQLGARSFFLCQSGGRLWFATDVRELVRLLPSRPQPERRSVVQWLVDGYLELGDTLFEGVRRLEGGHLVRLAGDRWQTVAYWRPSFVPPGKPTVEEAVAEIGAELLRSVRERTAEVGTTGILLSGGFDSSTVAATARRLEPAGELRAYSLVYPDRPELDESALIDQVAAALGLPVERMPVRTSGVLAAGLEFLRAWELPAVTPMFAFSQPLLALAAGQGIVVMLDGEGGDELFGCSPYVLADRLLRADVRGALALARRYPYLGLAPSQREVWGLVTDYGLKGAAPHGFHRALRKVLRRRYAPEWLRPAEARLYLDARDTWAWKRLPGPRWWSFLADLLVFLRQRLGAHDFFRQRSALAGIEGRHPWFDDLGLVELVLRLPPELTFQPSLDRPLARAAAAGVVPDAVRLRNEKPEFGQLVVDALDGPDLGFVTRLLRARDAEIWRYVKPEPVQALLEARSESRHILWARLLWRLVTIESWLRAQGDPDFVQRALDEGTAVRGGRSDAGRRRAVTS